MGVQLVTAISELDWNEIVSLFSDLNVCAYVLYIICIRMCVCVCACVCVREETEKEEVNAVCSKLTVLHDFTLCSCNNITPVKSNVARSVINNLNQVFLISRNDGLHRPK